MLRFGAVQSTAVLAGRRAALWGTLLISRMTTQSTAFLGAGQLASGMIEGLCRRGREVIVWNRTSAKARALEAVGATYAESIKSALREAQEIHLVLSDDDAVAEVLRHVRNDMAGDAYVIDHTTTHPTRTAERMRSAAVAGMKLVHAPVFMSPQNCRDGSGLMLVSGPAAVVTDIRASLGDIASDVWDLGESPGLAAAYKIFGNALMFAIASGLADVLAMATQLEIAPDMAVELFTRFKPGAVIQRRADKMARADFEGTFALTMARKDVGVMLEAAGDESLIVLPALAARMDALVAAGFGAADVCAIAATSLAPERLPGSVPSSDTVHSI